MSKILLFIGFVFLLTFSSALQVNLPQNSINKTYGVDTTFVAEIVNDNSFTYYNISLKDNLHLEMTTIPTLGPGQSINRTINVIADEDYSGEFTVRGYYEAQLGASNESIDINVYYSGSIENNLDVCDIILIKGDKVTWINNVADDISLIHEGVEAKTIKENEAYTYEFLQPQTFTYYFNRIIKFTRECSITVLDDSGYINNPENDADFNFNIDVQFQPTELEYSFFETNYTMDPFSQQEGVFTIKNTGGVIAKEVSLSAEWFTFNINNFDILPGYTKTISYKINPLLTSTNQTNKSYDKELKITGNFAEKKQAFNIKINYAEIDDGEYTQGKSLLEQIEEYCLENPDICGGGTKIIYRTVNDSEVNVSVTQNQLLELFQLFFMMKDDQDVNYNFLKEKYNELAGASNETDLKFHMIQSNLNDLIEEDKTQNNITIYMTIILFTTFICGGITYLILRTMKKRKLRHLINQKWEPNQLTRL